MSDLISIEHALAMLGTIDLMPPDPTRPPDAPPLSYAEMGSIRATAIRFGVDSEWMDDATFVLRLKMCEGALFADLISRGHPANAVMHVYCPIYTQGAIEQRAVMQAATRAARRVDLPHPRPESGS